MAALINKSLKILTLKRRNISPKNYFPLYRGLSLSAAFASRARLSWRQYYKNLVGVVEVKNARSKVIEKEDAFVEGLTSTHKQRGRLSEHWRALHDSRFGVRQTSTIWQAFPPVLAEELRLMKLEQSLRRQLAQCSATEQRRFSDFWNEVSVGFGSERGRQRRRAAWVAMACIVGTLLGIAGTYTSQYLWDYFRSGGDAIYDSASPWSSEGRLRVLATQLSDSVQLRSRDFLLALVHFRSTLSLSSVDDTTARHAIVTLADKHSEQFPLVTSRVIERVDEQNIEMIRIIEQLKLDAKTQPSAAPPVTTKPPEVVVAIREQEEDYESDIGALWRVTLVYGVLVMVVPVAFGALS